jgi:hypothetical protein
MICWLLREVRKYGGFLSKEGDKLRLEQFGIIPEPLKEQLRAHKKELLAVLTYEEEARKQNWLVLPDGMGFEKRLSSSSAIYIFREDDGSYTVWRGTWGDQKQPYSEKTIVENVDFKTAFDKANSYVEWFQQKG